MALLERDNYFILLGLDFDPPVTDTGRIKAALRACKQEWTRWQDNPGKRNAGLNYLSQAAEIERVMLDSALNKQEAEAAKILQGEMEIQFEAELRVLESKGYILPKEAAAIAVKYKAFGITPEKVESAAKCPIGEEAPPAKSVDDGEVIDRITARNIDRGLKILGHPTLYAFLNEPPYSSVKKLQNAAEQTRRTASSQSNKTPQSTITQELAGICASLFDSIASKQKYDRYLKVSKYPAVGELLDEEFARSRFVGPEVLLRVVNFAVEKYNIKVLEAEEYIKNYCVTFDIPLDNRGTSVACPACQNKTLRQDSCCAVCAQPINGVCPNCGEEFEGGPAACKHCGFAIKDMTKGLKFLGESETALIENNWSTAQRGLLYVKKYWPNHPKLELLEKRVALLEERYKGYVESIEDCVKHRQLYAAGELVSEADARHIKIPVSLVKTVKEQIAAFEKRISGITGDKNPDIEQLLRLTADVTDSIELSRLLASYPPNPPTELTASASGRQVLLTWGTSLSPYTNCYVVVRKQDSKSLTAFDGEVLYEGGANSFQDKTASPLIEYYYSVFSKRAGTYSKHSVTAKPVLIAPDVENLHIVPVDGGAQLVWDFNPDLRSVQIWRKLGGEAPVMPGDGILLENDRLDGFFDNKLKNDVEYWYYIVANYVINDELVPTKGVCGSVIPRKTIAPIEELNIVKTDDEDIYLISWDVSLHPDIILFCSAKKPRFSAGDIVPAKSLLTTFRKLDLDYKYADSATFKLRFSGGIYIFAATVFGQFATLGDPKYIVNVPDVESLTCDVIGENLHLNMKWPPSIGSVVVAYRFDAFVSDLDDSGTTTVSFTKEQYDFDASIVIRQAQQKEHYITVFSVFTTPDGRKVYSKGAQIKVNNRPLQEIFYSFAYKKKRFSETGVLDVTISSASKFDILKAVIVGKAGRLPLSRADGLPLFEIDGETGIESAVSLQFTTTPLPSNIYIKLFWHDDSMYEKYRLIPTCAAKIT